MARKPPFRAISSYLGAQAVKRETGAEARGAARMSRFVTISRQAGAGGRTVAVELARLLNASRPPVPWTVFDKELVKEVARRHDLPGEIERYLEEDAVPEIHTIVTELFGGPTSRRGLVAKTSETILHLAMMGNAILVGRAACVVTRRLPGGLHVRLVGSPERRLERMMALTGLKKDDARAEMNRRDRGRRSYLRQYFKTDVTDPISYDLVFNTDRVSYDDAARLVFAALELRTA